MQIFVCIPSKIRNLNLPVDKTAVVGVQKARFIPGYERFSLPTKSDIEGTKKIMTLCPSDVIKESL